MRIYKIGGYTKAIGRWINVATSSETNSVSWTFDSSKEDENSRSETNEKFLEVGLKMSFEHTVSAEKKSAIGSTGGSSKYYGEINVNSAFSNELTEEVRSL